MATFFPQTPTRTQARRARRAQLGDELNRGAAQAMGGFDLLANAQAKAAATAAAQAESDREFGLKREKLDAEKADLLARAQREAGRDALERERFDLDREKWTATQKRQGELDALEAAKRKAEDDARALEAGRKATEDSRGLLQKVVSGGLAEGKSLDDITKGAREMPGLENISGDEEVAGEYRRQFDDPKARAAREAKAMDLARGMLVSGDAEKDLETIEKIKAMGFSEEEVRVMMTRADRESSEAELDRKKKEAEIGLLDRKGRGGAGGAPDPLKAARIRKAEADASIAEEKLARIDQSGVKLSPSERKVIANTFETEAQVSNIIDLMDKAPPGVTQWARVQAARATGVGEVIGEDVDPGGHGRAFYNALEQFIIEERNRLMGASLTDNEKKAFERVSAAMHQSPETARLALQNYLTVMRLRREAAIKSAQLAAGLERGTVPASASEAPIDQEEADFFSP